MRGLLFAFMMAMGTLGVIAAAPLFKRVPARSISVKNRPAIVVQQGEAENRSSTIPQSL